MRLSVIITGASGMVGEGVLHECLQHPDVEHVLVVGRRACGTTHPKLKELLVSDLFDLTSIESELSGFDACYFCLGVSSIGMKEDAYRHITYDLTMNFAKTLVRLNQNMTFCYISGAKTDSSEKGRSMWARVKGKTENDLLKLPFKAAYNFRPGYIHPTPGLKNTLSSYKYITWLYPALRAIFPSSACSLREIGLAMIGVTERGYPKHILEVKDIVEAAG
ncbi:MAG TPA: NAD-dependent epimerase/dehydratase family protein [Candidatus Kapabacteria bacterium]|nr:NAD-dependent epimerase/dehydratase family protein [Candidatus Kapabacteria bacterium]